MNIDFSALAVYGPLLPEILLVVGAMIILLIGVFREDGQAGSLGWVAVALLVAAGLLVLRQPAEPQSLFNGAIVIDPFSKFMKSLALLGAAVTLFMSFDYMREARILGFEFPVLVLFSVAGMMMMISAGGLITLYLGLEMQSLALYVVAALRRDSPRSGEAGLKYFVLGALSSGMLLYGASLVYGFTGSTQFTTIAEQIQSSGAGVGLISGNCWSASGAMSSCSSRLP